MTDSYLEHHGVKGMHWGVRKDRDTTYAAAPKRGSAPDPERYKNWEKAGRHTVGKTLRDVGLVGITTIGGAVAYSNFVPYGSEHHAARGALGLLGTAAGAAGGVKLAKTMHRTSKTMGKVEDNRRSLAAGKGVAWKTDKTPEEVGELGKARVGSYIMGGAKNILLGPAGIAAGVGNVMNRELQRGLESQTHMANGKVKSPR